MNEVTYVEPGEYEALVARVEDRRARLAAALTRMRQCRSLADKLRAKAVVEAIQAEKIP